MRPRTYNQLLTGASICLTLLTLVSSSMAIVPEEEIPRLNESMLTLFQQWTI